MIARALSSEHARRRCAWAALAGLVVFGLWLRFTGLSFLTPHAWEPDSLVLVRQMEHIRAATPRPETDAFFGYYPQLVARLAAIVPTPAVAFDPSTLAGQLAAACAERIHVRGIVAALSILLVPATYLIARRFARRAEALFAAALVATSVLHLWFAQQARPHAASSAFAAWALLACLWARARNDVAGWLFAALALLGATASLQSGFALVPAWLAAFALRRAGSSSRVAWIGLGLFVVIVAIGARLYYPFAFSDESTSSATEFGITSDRLHLFGHALRLDALHGQGFAPAASTLSSYEPLLSILAVAGLCAVLAAWIRALRRSSKFPSWRELSNDHGDLCVVLAFALPYLIAIGLYEHTYQRFVLPLLPLCAILAARGTFAASALAGRALGSPARSDAPAFVLASTCFLVQAWVASRLSRARTQPDTLVQAAHWLDQHADARCERIVHDPDIDLPLWRTRAALASIPPEIDARFPWVRYQRAARAAPRDAPAFDLRALPILLPNERAWLQSDAPAYLASRAADWIVVVDQTSASSMALRAGSRAQGVLRARFSPWAVDDGSPTPLGFQDDYVEPRPRWWSLLLGAARCGPVVEIYRLARDVAH